MLNKKNRGQAADAVTWIVATVAIVVIMMFFIFAASLFSETKAPGDYKGSLFSKNEKLGDDLYLKKSLYTYVVEKKDSMSKKIMDDLEKKDSNGEFRVSFEDSKKEVKARYDLR